MTLIQKINRAVLAAFMFCLFAIILAEITLRYFGVSLNYSWEIGSYLMAAIFFMGCAQAIATDEHIRIQVPITSNGEILRWMRRVSDAIVALALLALAIAFANDVLREYSLNNKSFTQLQAPLYLAKLPVLMGAILSFLLHLQILLTDRRNSHD